MKTSEIKEAVEEMQHELTAMKQIIEDIKWDIKKLEQHIKEVSK